MMRNDDLISRAAAIAAFAEKREVWYGNGPLPSNESLMWQAAISIAESLPAVDAVPVVHGRWVKVHGDATPGGDPVWRCSECGKGVHVYGIEHGSYGAEIADGQWVSCPNCGAVMKGGDGGVREVDEE